jgi:hypothetical protein
MAIGDTPLIMPMRLTPALHALHTIAAETLRRKAWLLVLELLIATDTTMFILNRILLATTVLTIT